LPLDEPYRIPAGTVDAINRARPGSGRIVAIGTTVVRALEHAASTDANVAAGEGLATQRIGPSSRLRVVDAVLSGTHESGTGHYELLRAFAADATLRRMDHELNLHGYRTHEFGDSIFVESAAAIRASHGQGKRAAHQAAATAILPMRARHSRGPVSCTEVPLQSTATVTGMSLTSNS
jgi:S-adenosylmethionine:tRNA ribosyltransferase-isomerase